MLSRRGTLKSQVCETGAGELHDAEAFADQIDAAAVARNAARSIVGHAVDFDVEVFGFEAEQGVAHGAAHDDGLESGLAQVADDVFERELVV